jgi:hypothetical protein
VLKKIQPKHLAYFFSGISKAKQTVNILQTTGVFIFKNPVEKAQ